MGRLASAAEDAAPLRQRARPLLLVAAPDPVIRRMLQGLLQTVGYQVVGAADGSQTIALYERYRPDLVLLDLGDGDPDAFASCAALRALAGHQPLPLLTLADRPSATNLERAFRAGASDFQVKPVHPTLLRERIRQALNHRATALELAASRARAGTARGDAMPMAMDRHA